jgi:hypothetical protein
VRKAKSSSGKLHGLADAGNELGRISPWTLRGHIDAGTIPVVRIGRRLFLTDETLEKIKRDGLPSLTPAQRRIKPIAMKS